jgi:hypothetical protein
MCLISTRSRRTAAPILLAKDGNGRTLPPARSPRVVVRPAWTQTFEARYPACLAAFSVAKHSSGCVAL